MVALCLLLKGAFPAPRAGTKAATADVPSAGLQLERVWRTVVNVAAVAVTAEEDGTLRRQKP